MTKCASADFVPHPNVSFTLLPTLISHRPIPNSFASQAIGIEDFLDLMHLAPEVLNLWHDNERPNATSQAAT
jgi:hypothetical protein